MFMIIFTAHLCEYLLQPQQDMTDYPKLDRLMALLFSKAYVPMPRCRLLIPDHLHEVVLIGGKVYSSEELTRLGI
jgi:hypothetical protein